MPLRYLNLLFAVAITIAGWGTIEVALSVDRLKLEHITYPENKSSLGGKTCSEVYWIDPVDKPFCDETYRLNKDFDSINRTKKRIAADLRETGIDLRLWGILYGFVFLFWEAGLFIRKKKLRKNELLDQAPDEVDDA